jgi:ABC-type multidrug transport system ATPase subunit
VSFRDVEKRYGMRLALRGISLELGAGECVALLGHNGSGKTTLLKIAAQLARPSRGKISFYAGATELSPDAVKVRVGMVAHHTLVYDELTAEENLVFFAKLLQLPNATERARQSLAIARALLASPELVLLDEPAAGLDPEGQQWLGGTLASLHASGCTILMSTHGRNEAHASVTRAIRLENGAITHDSGPDGNPQNLMAMAAVREEGDSE